MMQSSNSATIPADQHPETSRPIGSTVINNEMIVDSETNDRDSISYAMFQQLTSNNHHLIPHQKTFTGQLKVSILWWSGRQSTVPFQFGIEAV
jgi:hypothetical protein